MKYPKPGYNNPLVSVHVFDLKRYEAEAAGFPAASATLELDWLGRHAKEDSIISEVTWVGDATLIVKEVNRAADDGNVVLFDIDIADERRRRMGRVVRKKGKNGEEGDDGWIESVNTLLWCCTTYFQLTIPFMIVSVYIPPSCSNICSEELLVRIFGYCPHPGRIQSHCLIYASYI